MENMFKRLLSLAIALVMIIGMIPGSAFSVFAAEEDSVIDTEAELTTALAAGGTVTLGGDFEVTTMIEIPAGVTATLDLNGHNITSAYQANSTSKHIYPLSNYGTLTIKDSVGTGSITGRGIYNQSGATITVDGAKIVAQDWNGGAGIWCYGTTSKVYLNDATIIGYTGVVSSEGYLEINGGTYTCYSGVQDDGTLVTPTYSIRANGGLKITDGTFTSRHGVISVGSGEAVIEDGSYTIEFTGATTSNVVYVYGTGSLTINGGEFTSDNTSGKADSGAAVLVSGTTAAVEINDGTFVGMNGMVSVNDNTVINGGSFDTVWDYNHYGNIEAAVTEGATVTVAGTNYTKTESGLEEVKTSGTITSCLVNLNDSAETFISSEIQNLNATESVVIKLYSGETQIATTTLQKPEYYVAATLGVKIIITGESSSWKTEWAEGMPRADMVPDKVTLYVDGTEMNSANVPMISTNGEESVNWADVPGVNSAPVTGLEGSGTEADPFLINNLEELVWFRDSVDQQLADGTSQYTGKYIKLMADIDLAGINWNPIGSMTGDHGSFKGIFDGNNHTISNLNVQTTGTGLGLFARTAGNAEIKNLTLNNVTVKSTDNSNYVGAVVANSYASTKITNVHVTGAIDISGRGYIGGISGHGYVVMDNVSVIGEGTISSTFWCAGGILGYGGEGATNITNATVEGTGNGLTITSAAGGLGAIVGMAQDNDGTQPISGANLSAKNVTIETYEGAYGTAYANYALGYLYGGNPTSQLTGELVVEDVAIVTSTGEEPQVNDAVATVDGTIYFDLQAALDAAAAGTGNVTVEILRDVDLTNVDWNPVTVSAPGYPVVTVNGNEKTITGLNDMLFAGTWAGNSGLIINDLTIADSTIENDVEDTKGTVGVGAFIGYPQASATITLNNCHLVDSSVSGGHWTGGLIGMAGGYNGTDGPVFMNLTITDCSVTGSTITGKGSAGGVIGHSSCAAWTNVVIENTTVSGNTVTSTGSSTNKAGSVMGTIGAAGQETTVNGVTKTGGTSVSATVSGNTVTSGGTTITTVYGRQGSSTGELTVTGGTYDSYPIEQNVSYAAPAEGYVIADNGDGTYSVKEDPSYGMVAQIGDTYYATLAEALAAVTDSTTIELLADATLDYNARDVIGTAETTSLTINGNGHTLTLNQKNSDWASIGLTNADAKLVLNDMTVEKTGYGDTSGAWNTHAIIITSNVEMNDVTVNNSLAVKNGATLNNVTINEANGYYGLWIDGNGQTVSVTGGSINATNGGRGIKIADEYVSTPAAVTLTIDGTDFNTAKKAAVLVSSTAGAKVTGTNCDITDVAADQVNLVWVDEDWAGYYHSVKTYGDATKAQENAESFPIVVYKSSKEGTIRGYFNDLDELFAAKSTQIPLSDNYIELRGDVVANNRVNVSYNNNYHYTFGTSVDGGVTMTFNYADDWNLLPHFTLGENVTLNTKYLQVIGGDIEIAGTLNTDYLYLYGTGEGVTVTETGAVNATTGDATVQVKGGTVLTVNGKLNTSTLNVWTQDSNNSELIVSGENAELTAAHLHAWNGYDSATAQNVTVADGATLTATNFQADRGSVVTVDAATLTADTLTLGYQGNVGYLNVVNDGVLTNGAVLNSVDSTVTGPEGMNVTTNVADYKVVYEAGVYKLVAKEYVAQIGETKYETLAEAFTAAVDGDEVVILVAGTYALSTSGKDITITGAVDGVEFTNIGAKNMGGASVTFNNVTFTYGNDTYKGLQHAGDLVYNNCTINGQVFLYGTSETFNNCTFNQTSSDAYNVWTYGAKEVNFNECTFNSAGKSVLVYNEGACATALTVTDSTFVASTAVDGKAAIEIDTSLMPDGTTVVINNTTATGFDAGSVSGDTLWNDKKDQTDLTVTVDSEKVWPIPELPTATVTEIENDELTFAMNFTSVDPTAEQLAYYGDWYADFVLTINKEVTFNANGGADGYLSGQYDGWSENWVDVPTSDVTLEANKALKIMEFAAELYGQSGLQVTYNDVATGVKDFDCGVYFTPEFLLANPDLEVTLELRMYNPADENESYTIGQAYEFTLADLVAVNTATGKTYTDVVTAMSEAEAGQTVALMKDVTDVFEVSIYEDTTLDLNGYALTTNYFTSYGDAIDSSDDNSGLLNATRILMQADNAQLPVNTAEGYRFVEVVKIATATLADGRLAFQVTFEDAAHEMLKQGATITGVNIQVNVSWNQDGNTRTQNFVYTDAHVIKYLNSYNASTGKYSQMFTLGLSGTENFTDLTTTVVVVSTTGVEVSK